MTDPRDEIDYIAEAERVRGKELMCDQCGCTRWSCLTKFDGNCCSGCDHPAAEMVSTRGTRTFLTNLRRTDPAPEVLAVIDRIERELDADGDDYCYAGCKCRFCAKKRGAGDREWIAAQCQTWAVERFDIYGPKDARGATLWDVAAWLREGLREPTNTASPALKPNVDHDEWCDANGCRCGKCPCLGPPSCVVTSPVPSTPEEGRPND